MTLTNYTTHSGGLNAGRLTDRWFAVCAFEEYKRKFEKKIGSDSGTCFMDSKINPLFGEQSLKTYQERSIRFRRVCYDG